MLRHRLRWRPAPSPPVWHPPAASAPPRCATSMAATAAARGRQQLRQLRNRRGTGKEWVKVPPKNWRVNTKLHTKLNEKPDLHLASLEFWQAKLNTKLNTQLHTKPRLNDLNLSVKSWILAHAEKLHMKFYIWESTWSIIQLAYQGFDSLEFLTTKNEWNRALKQEHGISPAKTRQHVDFNQLWSSRSHPNPT